MSTHDAQATSEGVILPRADDDGNWRIEFMGEQYRIADEPPGTFTIARFAAAADAGIDGGSAEGLAAFYAILRDVIHPDDWGRFGRDASNKRAGEAELDKALGDAFAAMAARPTPRPSDSPSGQPATPENSKATSSSPDTPLPDPTPIRRPPGADELRSVDSLMQAHSTG